jgi:5-formyltetrahydrofolate cyclo-ligase
MICMSETKASLRKDILAQLKSQKEVERLQNSRVIKDKLFSSDEYRHARTILFYASFAGEVDTSEMMRQAQRQSKTIVLPVISESQKKITPSQVLDLNCELEIGPYGVLHPKKSCFRPVDLDDIDLVIVPGVAFDKKGNRLGRGKGYYDRLLKNIPPHIPTVGLAFAFQILDTLPQLAEHDCPVKKVITA